MKIAICDDEKEFRDPIRVYIEDYLNIKDILYTIDTIISGEKILSETSPSEYSIIFLDINMEGMDGITTAKKIRERGINSYIVFVTAYIDYSLEGYKVGAVRYLLKNGYNLQAAMEECLDAILEKKKSLTEGQRLFIGVDSNEFNAADGFLHHSIYSIISCTTYTDYDNLCR